MPRDLKTDFSDAPVLKFGDLAAASPSQLDMMRAGKKTATSAPLRDYEDTGTALPEAGQTLLVQGVDGSLALAVRITGVSTKKFLDVDEAQATAEGMGSRDAWISARRAEIGKAGGWSAFMEMVCCTFEVVGDAA